MSDTQTNIYEGLFLFPQAAATNLQAAVDHMTELLTRAEAEVLSLKKWDERRLAYEIKGNKRGIYFLTYFRVDPSRLVGLERDCNLSEQLLRAMVLRAEHIPTEVIEATEGREQIEDEIRLRGEEGSEAERPRSESATAVVEKPEG